MGKNLFILSSVGVAGLFSSFASAALYGVSTDGRGDYRFVSINSTTGAASTLFSFALPGTQIISSLTYVPTTNKFVGAANVAPNFAYLVEIDATSQTVAAIANNIPSTSYMEGVEYSSALGGIAVSYGANNFTWKLALLNTSYGLIGNNTGTLLQDCDTLFVDNTGALNALDTNNPTNSSQRNRILNPFPGPETLQSVGTNAFATSFDYDVAFDSADSNLYLTRATSLATINPLNNGLTSVGGFGAGYNVTGIAAGPVPEPASLIVLGLGGVALVARRRSR